jgi:signal transduction histidine kinase/CheY-like chemotaxis protein
MVELLAAVQGETDNSDSEEPVIQALRTMYPDAVISLQTSRESHIAVEGRNPIALSELSDGLWEDTNYIDDFILLSNHLELSTDRVVRVIAAPCESVSGTSFLIVGTKNFRQVFDDVDAWFLQTCSSFASQMWHKRLLREVMVAKEKFLRGFSHQLRTPVHGILGSVELLAEELNASSLSDAKAQTLALLQSTSELRSNGETKVFLDTIKRAGRDLISIINSMITLNRWADVASAERHYTEYTMHDLEKQLANELQNAISWDTRYNASILFDHDLPPDDYSVHTDLSLFGDSVLPLIVNAIQNTTEGFVIITLSVRPESDELVVDVKDTGRGIAIKDQQRIFELYEQTDVYSTGAGLGLTLASRFASLLKGSVDLISSEVDQGSHFRATFKDVAMACRKPSSTIGSLVPKMENIPKHFHIIHSSSVNALLCDHFG